MTATAAVQTADYVNPVLASTKATFEATLGCTPRRSGMELATPTAKYDVSAIIGITGSATGTIVVSLSARAAMQALQRMVGVEAAEIDADVLDAVGELCNMIAGGAKAKLEHHQLAISIPNMVSGVGHQIHYPSQVQPIRLQFESELGPFCIDVGFSF